MPATRPGNPKAIRVDNLFGLCRVLLGLAVLMAFAAAAESIERSISTENGIYTVTIRPGDSQIPVGKRHPWTVSIRDRDGAPIRPSQLAFYGGMPAHGHGLPSAPRVTRELSLGTYLVEGVLFNMHGEWQIVIGVVGSAGVDKAVFDLSIEPAVNESARQSDWSPSELALMRSLALLETASPVDDPSNRFSLNPDAIALGEKLFSDPGLSRGGDISCATCHEAQLHFTDGKRLSEGSKQLKRNSPTLLAVAHSDWLYWDGRRDSVWAQAVTPIETIGEMDNDRLAVVRYVMTHDTHSDDFARLVNELPKLDELPKRAGPFGSAEVRNAWSGLTETQRLSISSAFASIGKVIASYVATLEPAPSRFDLYVKAVAGGEANAEVLTATERRGLRLFLDSARTHCLRCHNGPYFSNFGFHNIGTSIGGESELPDFGRMIGIRAAMLDEFNCVGKFSDAAANGCDHHRYAAQGHADNGAFKVPTLRNVAETGPYMHDGRFDTLMAVLEFYRDPPPQATTNHELPSLELTDDELADLAAFLDALTSSPPNP